MAVPNNRHFLNFVCTRNYFFCLWSPSNLMAPQWEPREFSSSHPTFVGQLVY